MDGTGELPNDSRRIRRDIESRLLVEEGLELGIVVEVDAEELFLKIDENRRFLREWLPWLDEIQSDRDEISFISMSLGDFENREGAIFAIRLDGNIIGPTSLNWIDWAN